MTIYSEISESDNCIIHVALGTTTMAEIVKAYSDALSESNFEKGMNSVWDFTSASFTGSREGLIQRFVEAIQGFREQRGQGQKVALVVKTSEDYGLGKDFEINSEESLSHHARVFYKMERALEWMKSSLSDPSMEGYEGD